jgi:hypothetical protein
MKKVLRKLTMLIMLSEFALPALGQCLPGWKFTMPVAVNNNTFASLKDYQVKVTLNTAIPIAASKMTSTGDDIRFVDANSCKLLQYWIESGMNSANTVIWIKLPVLGASSTRNITMYYGNATAAPMSNGDSTFIIFDDFNGTKLNTEKWQTVTTSTNAALTVSNGKLNCSTDLEANIRSKAAFSNPIIAEANMTSISGSWDGLALLNANTNDGYSMWEGTVNTGGSTTMYTGDAFTPANPACHNYTTHTRSTNANPGTVMGIWSLSWPSSNVQLAQWPGGVFNNTYNYVTQAPTVQIAAGNMCGATGSMSIDWIRARNYAASEATTTVGNEHSTGIENITPAYNVNIYPNPAYNEVHIDLQKADGNIETLQLLDINGKIMNNMIVAGKRENINIQVADLAKGVYFIKMTGKNGVLVEKVIVE